MGVRKITHKRFRKDLLTMEKGSGSTEVKKLSSSQINGNLGGSTLCQTAKEFSIMHDERKKLRQLHDKLEKNMNNSCRHDHDSHLCKDMKSVVTTMKGLTKAAESTLNNGERILKKHCGGNKEMHKSKQKRCKTSKDCVSNDNGVYTCYKGMCVPGYVSQ